MNSFIEKFKRYRQLFSRDIKQNDPNDGQVFTYMFSCMSKSEREIIEPSTQLSLEILTNDAIFCYYIFNLNFRDMQYRRVKQNCSYCHNLILPKPIQDACDKYGTIRDRIKNPLSEELEKHLMSSLVIHELIHYLIGASFDLRGDRFVAAISANIKMDTMNSKCRWEDYLDATYKTKFLSQSIKEMVQNYQLKVKLMSEYILNLLNHYAQLLMDQKHVSIEEIYGEGGRMDLYIPNHSFPRLYMI